MQLCLMVEGQEGVTWSQWTALAQACEAHGVPALFRSDHYANLDGRHPEHGALDAWGTLCALAAVTSTLRLGTVVSPATFRHPSQLAKLVATADHVSGGRVELGMGAGWHEREHTSYGFKFDDVRTRIDVLEEQIQIVLGNWTGSASSPFSFEGVHYRLEELNAQPKPVQSPHPTLILGGLAGPRSAALGARFADEYNIPFPSSSELRERRERLERACEREGREALPISVMVGLVVATNKSELDTRVRLLSDRFGLPDVTADAPQGWIVGTVEQAAEQLSLLRAAGVGRVMCQLLLHDDLDSVALIGGTLPALVG
jgi:F420-dependent oxidoreductase-like protein